MSNKPIKILFNKDKVVVPKPELKQVEIYQAKSEDITSVGQPPHICFEESQRELICVLEFSTTDSARAVAEMIMYLPIYENIENNKRAEFEALCNKFFGKGK